MTRVTPKTWSDKVIQLSSDTLVSSAGSLLHRKQSQVKDYPRHRRHMGYIKASSAILKAFLAFCILWCQDTERSSNISETRFTAVILGVSTEIQGAIAYSVLLILSTEKVLPL